MKNGDQVVSKKDGKPEILVLRADGCFYGNRTAHNYGKMDEQKKIPKGQDTDDKGKSDNDEQFKILNEKLDKIIEMVTKSDDEGDE